MNISVTCFADLETGGGGATHARNLSEGLRDLGHAVTLIGKSSPGVSISKFADGIQVESHPVSPGFAWRVPTLTQGRALVRVLARFPAPEVAVVLSHLHVRAVRKAWPGVPVIFVVPVLLAKCLRAITEKPSFYEKLDTAIIRRSELYALREADMLIALGPAMIEDMHGLTGSALPAISLPVGVIDLLPLVRIQSEEFRRLSNTPVNAGVVLCVGRLDENKRFDRVVRAFAAVASPKDHLWLCGEGPSEKSLRALVDSMGIASRAHFLGHQRVMANVYSASDLLVHAASYEAFGQIYLEAMVSGIPVVGPKHVPGQNFSALQEIITHGTHGFLYDPQDQKDLEQALSLLLTDDKLRRNLGNNAREHALQHFSWAEYSRKIETLILDIGLKSTASKKNCSGLEFS